MTRCAYIKPGGERCKAIAMVGYETCYGHRPDLVEERRRIASKGGRTGGRGRGSSSAGELSEIKDLLKNLTDRVTFVEGSEYLPANHAAVAAQLINTQLRAIALEKQVKEQEEIIERIERLERATEGGQRGGRRWGP
jgi:hypothetical protein